MGKGLYPKLAWQNIRRDGKFYLPYFLSIIGCVAGFYIVSALGNDQGLPMGNRYAYLSAFWGSERGSSASSPLFFSPIPAGF